MKYVILKECTRRRFGCKLVVAFFFGAALQTWAAAATDPFRLAAQKANVAAEGYRRCMRYVEGWLDIADSETGLIPSSTSKHYWDAHNAAADNYPFMVLTTSICKKDMFNGRMLDMLNTEKRLTSTTHGDIPCEIYDFAQDRCTKGPTMFGASEYVKDGLMPLTEWLGTSPWSSRMIEIIDDMFAYGDVVTPQGKTVPSLGNEEAGEICQVLSRIYWLTGEEKYLDWAIWLADHFLHDGEFPTDLRLRDHGCEIVSGLCEVYVTTHFARPEKALEYKPAIHGMLDYILEHGRNEHGIFYNEIGTTGLSDTWGYTYNAFYSVWQIDSITAYHEAIELVLSNLWGSYKGSDFGEAMDGRADAVEGALSLYNRIPYPSSVILWIDDTMQRMWALQQNSGRIEGWHGDGNFARTTIMYALWKARGLRIEPWRSDVALGAVQSEDSLYIHLSADSAWTGSIQVDRPRHKDFFNLPADWPRINSFPEWAVADSVKIYTVTNLSEGITNSYFGHELTNNGVSCTLESADTLQIVMTGDFSNKKASSISGRKPDRKWPPMNYSARRNQTMQDIRIYTPQGRLLPTYSGNQLPDAAGIYVVTNNSNGSSPKIYTIAVLKRLLKERR